MNNPVGGYFSLEISTKINNYPHSEGIHLNSGRNTLEYILMSISVIDCIWIPYYTCEVILEPIKKLGIPYKFYHIDEHLELADEILLNNDEYLLVTNYFGIKDTYLKKLAVKYGKHLIVDNAQALFAEPIEGIKTIYSPRKFVGIPDGGIAYIENGMDTKNLEQDVSYNRCSHLLKRLDLGAEDGYADFKENSYQLVNQPVKRMSNLTWSLMQSVDYEYVKKRRRENFKCLNECLSGINRFQIPNINTFACPMVYPLYTSDMVLKNHLIDHKIFVATYWPNVVGWCEENSLEYDLAKKVIAIPIDQRYKEEDMNRIVNIILK